MQRGTHRERELGWNPFARFFPTFLAGTRKVPAGGYRTNKSVEEVSDSHIAQGYSFSPRAAASRIRCFSSARCWGVARR